MVVKRKETATSEFLKNLENIKTMPWHKQDLPLTNANYD